MRAPLSIALRLGLLFAAIAAAVFVATGTYLYQTLSAQMSRRDDADLLDKAMLVRQLLDAGAREPARLHDALGRVIGQDGVMLRVAAPAGRMLIDTIPARRDGALATLAPVPAGRDPGLGDIATLSGADAPTRALSVLAGGGTAQVTLMRMRSDRLAILKRYAFDLAGALAAGALLAAALGALAVRHGLRPLYGMIARADAITARRLDTRLPVEGMPAELRPLSAAFNAMLGRLEDGVERLSGFAADLAHDMRTPVNVLMMQSQVALSRERSAEEYQALLASNLEEYERLSRLIENTLFLARADHAQLALRPEVLDARSEMAHILDYFDMLAEDKAVALTLAAPAGLRLEADPILLGRALSNLVSNALAHTPSGGEIRLDARCDGSWLALSVANTGAGLPAAQIAHVFERHYRGDAARQSGHSTGLGLAIVRAIMRLHGGSAHAANAAGGLTVFTLRFPATVAPGP